LFAATVNHLEHARRADRLPAPASNADLLEECHDFAEAPTRCMHMAHDREHPLLFYIRFKFPVRPYAVAPRYSPSTNPWLCFSCKHTWSVRCGSASAPRKKEKLCNVL